MRAVLNYHELVDISEKLASERFELLNMVHYSLDPRLSLNCAFFVQHACGFPTAPTPCADSTRLRMLKLDEGKASLR